MGHLRAARFRYVGAALACLALGACTPAPLSIFWEPAHYGQNNLFTPGGANAATLPADACNSGPQTQVPGHPDLFVGRVTLDGKYDGEGNCVDGKTFGLALYSLDWNTFRVTRLRTILGVGGKIQGGNVTLDSAFDVYIVRFKSEYWVAFECYGHNSKGHQKGGTCVAPLDDALQSVDTARTTITVTATWTSTVGAHAYSASQPKLLAFGDNLYVYSSMVESRYDGLDANGKRKDTWLAVRAKGALLKKETSGSHRMWVSGSAGASAEVDTLTEVWPLGGDAQSNSVADIFDVTSDGTTIYATAGVGGGAVCPTVLPLTRGCYRLAIARGGDPLSLNHDRVPDSELPGNSAGYNKFVRAPDGTLYLAGGFQPPLGDTPNPVPHHDFVLYRLPPALRAPETIHEPLENGSFEGTLGGWAYGGATNFVTYFDPANAHDGNWYAATNTASSSGSIYQDVGIPVSPGDAVVASAWMRAQDTPASGVFCVFGLDQKIEGNCEGYNVDATAWQPVELVLNPSVAHQQVRVQVYPTTGTTRVDTVTAHSERGLRNGAFEGTTLGWSTYGVTNLVTYTDPTYAHDGNSFAATNTFSPGGSIYQDVNVAALVKDTIVASAWVRPEGASAQGQLCAWGLDGTVEGQCEPYAVSDQSWHHLQIAFSVTSPHATARIQLYPSVGTVRVDTATLHREAGLHNASFEGSLSGWAAGERTGTNFVAYYDPSNAHDGSWYAATNTSVSGGSVYTDADVPGATHDPIVASMWVRAQDTPATGQMCVFGLDSTIEAQCEPYNVTSAQWQHVQIVLSPTSAHRFARVQLYPGAGTTRLDTVTVHR